MRPSDITDGITCCPTSTSGRWTRCFNEAVGYYRRNRALLDNVLVVVAGASMRPSDITDGIEARAIESYLKGHLASMRPSDITDGIIVVFTLVRFADLHASMRPSDITDGIGPRPNPS